MGEAVKDDTSPIESGFALEVFFASFRSSFCSLAMVRSEDSDKRRNGRRREGTERTVFNFLVWVGIGAVMIELIQHFAPLVNDTR
jgi:hypothetical protein